MNQYNDTGDNVAGNKIIVHNHFGVSQSHTQALIEDTFKSILLLEIETARQTLTDLEKLQGKESNVANHINFLKVLFNDITQNKNDSKNIDLLKSNASNDDLATAILINHFVINKKKDDALKLYEQFDKDNLFIRSTYNYQIIKKEELRDVIQNKLTLYTDFDKQNLTLRCSIVGDSSDCEDLLDEINQIQGSKTNTLFKFWLKKAILFKNIGETHYYLSTYENKKKLDTFVAECEELINSKNYDWRFVLNVLFPLSAYIEFSNELFIRICAEQADNIKFNYQNEWQLLALHDDFVSVTEDDEWTYHIRQSEEDIEYREKILNQIKKKTFWNASEANFFLNYGNINEIDIKSVTVDTDNDVMKLILEVKLELLHKNENNNAIDESSLIERFNHLTGFDIVAPKSILLFCEELMFHKGYHLVVLLLKQLIGERTELWFSPIIRLYAESLIYLKQYETFHEVCSKVNNESFDELYHFTYAKFYHECSDDKDLAVYHIQESLRIEPNNFSSWTLFSHFFNHKYNVDTTFFDYIPHEIFNNFENQNQLRILIALANLKKYEFINELLIEKFIQNPTKYCKTISEFFIQHMIGEISFDIPNNDVGILNAVEYEIQGKTRRVLITEKKHQNNYCVHKNDDLGRQLISVKQGDIIDSNRGQIKIKNTYPPLILVNHICSLIRNENNNGDDAFQILNFDTENVGDSVKNLLYITKQMNKDKNEILDNDSIPYFMKLAYLSKSEFVNSSLELLCNPNTAKQLSIFNNGQRSQKFVADLNTCLYFAITGFIEHVLNEFEIVISETIKQILDRWLIDIEQGKTLGLLQTHNEKLVFSDKSTLIDNSIELRSNIKKLIETASVEKLKPCDIPPDIVKITDEEYLDLSLSSSIEVALSHNLPLLTIDPRLAEFLQIYNVQIQNPSFVFDYLCNNSSYTERKRGIELLALNNLPFIFHYDDILKYVIDKDIHKYFILYNLIDKPIFHNDKLKHNILTALVGMINYDSIDILNHYTYLNQLDEYRFVLRTFEQLFNKLFYQIISIKNDLTAEQKMAKLIYDVFMLTTRNIKFPIVVNGIHKRFIRYVSIFSHGHFLSVDHINNELNKLFQNNLESKEP